MLRRRTRVPRMRSFLLTLVAAGAFAACAFAAASAPEVVAKIAVPAGSGPCAAFKGGRFVWVSLYRANAVLRVDPATNKVVGRTKVGSGPCGLGVGAGSVWIEDTGSSTISRVSITTGRRTAAVRVGPQPYDATYAFGG